MHIGAWVTKLFKYSTLFRYIYVYKHVCRCYYYHLHSNCSDKMEITPFLETLLSQSALVVLMGFVSYVLWKEYLKEKEKKDNLSEAVVKITLLWEEKYSKESIDERDIKIFMQEIRDIIRDMRDGK